MEEGHRELQRRALEVPSATAAGALRATPGVAGAQNLETSAAASASSHASPLRHSQAQDEGQGSPATSSNAKRRSTSPTFSRAQGRKAKSGRRDLHAEDGQASASEAELLVIDGAASQSRHRNLQQSLAVSNFVADYVPLV